MVEPYNKTFIKEYVEILKRDEYSDLEQKRSRKINKFIPEEFKEFIARNIKPGTVLDIGCGSGDSFELYPVTHAVEPNPQRRAAAIERAKKLGKNIVINEGFAENLPFADKSFDTVLCIDAWNQLRSDLEAICEVNRVLKIGGVFIVDIWDQRNPPLYYGRVYAMPHYIYWLRQFGFEIIERRLFVFEAPWLEGVKLYRWGVALEKVEDVDLELVLRKLQLVPEDDKFTRFRVRNFILRRDGWLL